MVDGNGGDGWQWPCTRNEDGTGNGKVVETGKQQQHQAAVLLITAAATPSNSPNNHDAKHQASIAETAS